MTSKEKKESFKQELLSHMKRERLIRSYQKKAETGTHFVGGAEEMSLELLELVRGFSLQLLPEIKARNDFEFAEELQGAWESLKETYDLAHEETLKARAFEDRLAADLAENAQKQADLIKNSGFDTKEIEEIYQELTRDIEAEQGADHEAKEE